MRQQKHGKPEVYANAFWRFSLALYARPGVAEALIALQDRAGNDVNLILFALWRGVVHGHRLDQGELTAAEAAIAPLRRDVIEPLRKLRRGLKDNSDPDLQALRRRIGGLELAVVELEIVVDDPPRPRPISRFTSAPRRNQPKRPCSAEHSAISSRAAEGHARRGFARNGRVPSSGGSPHRRTVPVSIPNRSRIRPRVWSIISSIVCGLA